MILRERQEKIVNALRADGAASVSDLAKTLQVSESTIRRDLDLLDRNGELVRTYGGAMVAPRQRIIDAGDARPTEGHFEDEADAEIELKRAVALRAAALVPDDAVALLDIGTTTPLIARALRGRPITVITSSLAVLDELRDDESVRLIMLGGVLRRNYRTFVGSLSELALSQVRADIVFLTCTGVRPNGDVVDDMAVEAPIKQAMLRAADHVALVATAAKFPGSGGMRLFSLDDVDTLVTTQGADAQTLERHRTGGGTVIVA